MLKHPGVRNRHQSVTLLDAIAELELDSCIGGARAARRRRARRSASSRSGRVRRLGSQEPAAGAVEPVQRARPQGRERARVPDLNWTELDVWQYIARERLEIPSIYFAHKRAVVRRGGALVPVNGAHAAEARRAGRGGLRPLPHGRRHHLHRAGRVTAATLDEIVAETAATTITERGATRLDDQTSDASMEQRKKEGYFLMLAAEQLAAPTRTASCAHLRRRRWEARSSGASSSTRSPSSPTRCTPSSARRTGAGSRRWISRSSPTACRRSASRGSPSTWRTATSPPARASTSSPTRPATSSTRATW